MLSQVGLAKIRVPAVEGWFSIDESEPCLLGSKCTKCGTIYFPQEGTFCKNPRCRSETFEQVRLSNRGKIWSYTDAQYQPPPPYVAVDPFEPFAIVAVELIQEKLIVLGQVVRGVTVDDLRVGMEVELTIDTLYEDEDKVYLVWKFRPVNGPETLRR
jgi:uncharacterized OB-fold protein